MSVRTTITLTDPRHDLIILDEGNTISLGSPTEHCLVHLPEGHDGHQMLAKLADQIITRLTLQGWTTGDAA